MQSLEWKWVPEYQVKMTPDAIWCLSPWMSGDNLCNLLWLSFLLCRIETQTDNLYYSAVVNVEWANECKLMSVMASAYSEKKAEIVISLLLWTSMEKQIPTFLLGTSP